MRQHAVLRLCHKEKELWQRRLSAEGQAAVVYGNIDLQSSGFRKDSYLQKQMKVLTESEELLTNNLTGEEKKAFLSFANASNIILGELELDAINVGFRLAHYNKRYRLLIVVLIIASA